MRRQIRWFAALATLSCLVWMGLSCGEDKPEIVLDEEAYDPVINPDDFLHATENEYMPLVVGTVWEYEGDTEEGKETIRVVVTPETKTILGVTCAVVRDTVKLNGELIEDTYDWFANDKDGNVWYFGEDSKDYEKNVVVSTAGSWEAGVSGAKPGIVMRAHPQVGDTYRQEFLKGSAEDMAEVLNLNESVSVKTGSYKDVLRTKEWTPLEPDVVEHKFYAKGVGLVLETVVKGGKGRIELVRVTKGE
jgi:hypothetical protein